jgi:hypothetical protein
MFIQNKYTHWYNTIISKAQQRDVSGYIEKHHIIPKSLGGSDDAENLVKLTAKEHFICHLLLTKMTTGKANKSMWHAAWKIVNQQNEYQLRYKVNSRMYEMIKTSNAKALSESLTGKPSGRKGVPCTWGDKISATLKGNKPTAERNAKVSESLTGRKRSKEECAAISNGLKGRTSPTKGLKYSDESKAKISAARKGSKRHYLLDGTFIMIKPT